MVHYGDNIIRDCTCIGRYMYYMRRLILAERVLQCNILHYAEHVTNHLFTDCDYY